MQQLSFRLTAFEGPLDLLLTLIRKNKVNIYDIPISEILDQYLEAVSDMQSADIEVASEFLVTAATLLRIKSQMLLPKSDLEGEGEDDPREELVRRLIEYRRCKAQAEYLRGRENMGAALFFKAPDIIERENERFDYSRLTLENLHDAYLRALTKLERRMPPPVRSFRGIVGHEPVSVRGRVKNIWNKLIKKSKMFFNDIFKGTKSRPELVASFLAVLELIKLKKIRVEDSPTAGGDMVVHRIAKSGDLDFESVEE